MTTASSSKAAPLSEPAPTLASKRNREEDEAITRLHDEMEQVENTYEDKLREATQKMWRALMPVLTRRNQLLRASELCRDEHGGFGTFWWRVLAGSEQSPMYDHFDPTDERVFRALQDLQVTLKESSDLKHYSFRVVFKFAPNPFLHNVEVWREVRHSREEVQEAPSRDVATTCSGVQWKPGTEKWAATSFLNYFTTRVNPVQESEINAALIDIVYLNPLQFYKTR